MRWAGLSLALCLSCTRDLRIEDRLYFCSASAPCAAGFVCDPVRLVCVRPGESPPLDGGAEDADAPVRYCGDGVRTQDEACDDGNDRAGDGCESCTLQPLLRRSVPGTPSFQAVTAWSGRVYATGTAERRPNLLVFDEAGEERARTPVQCRGRDRGYLYALTVVDGALLATGHLYGAADVQGDLVVRVSRAVVRFDAAGLQTGCQLAPPEPTEATGRFAVPLPGGGALVGGNFTRAAFDPEAEDAWLTRLGGPELIATATAARVEGLRLVAATLGGDGSLYAVGRRGPWLSPTAVLLAGDPGLDALRTWSLPGPRSLSAVAPRPGGAWLLGQTADGRPFVAAASTSSVGATRALALSRWIAIEILAAASLPDHRVVIAGRRTDFDGSPAFSASFWAILDAEGRVQKEVVLDVPEAIDQLVSLSLEGSKRVWLAGARDGVGVIELWAVD